MLNYSLTCSCS